MHSYLVYAGLFWKCEMLLYKAYYVLKLLRKADIYLGTQTKVGFLDYHKVQEQVASFNHVIRSIQETFKAVFK